MILLSERLLKKKNHFLCDFPKLHFFGFFRTLHVFTYLTPQDPEDFSIIEVNLEEGDELGLLVVVVVVVEVVRGVVVVLGFVL